MSERPVVIVGAGLAGLACALDLQRRGIAVRVLEAAERPGGCLWTDEVEGFRLDRGFQVFLEGYPEARARLDYGALALQRFVPGARVFSRGRMRTLADPLRRPGDALRSLLSGIATPADALRVLRLRARLRGRSLEQILTAPQESTRDRLRALGFSARSVDEFLRPFFAGVFLDSALSTSSRAFEFTFRTFSSGAISLPARGIQAVPEQLAARLAPGTLRCEAPVAQLASGGNVVLAGGGELAARAVVVATHKPEALRLLGSAPARASRSATTLWWAARTPPARGPYLILDGDGAGPVNHVCVVSEIAPSLAPPGAALVSATAIGASAESDASLDARSRAQLRDWFGARVEDWRLLRAQHIRDTLPTQEPARFEPVTRSVEAGPGRFVCGGHRETASIGGALRSGRRAAHAVAASFAR